MLPIFEYLLPTFFCSRKSDEHKGCGYNFSIYDPRYLDDLREAKRLYSEGLLTVAREEIPIDRIEMCRYDTELRSTLLWNLKQ